VVLGLGQLFNIFSNAKLTFFFFFFFFFKKKKDWFGKVLRSALGFEKREN
jgi:hypothetical protein